VSACLGGECECGEAARYLEPGDARTADLARIGCDDGEPEACFVLGDLYERGAGVDRDPVKAFVWSEEGGNVDKDRDRAFFYARLACRGNGIELDQGIGGPNGFPKASGILPRCAS
jgi:TPR repeat protein